MAANAQPRYTLLGDPSSDALAGSPPLMAPVFTTAAADYDGTTATHNKQVFKAGAEGSRICGLRFKAKSSTGSATVARIFLNNGSANTSAANNSFFAEIPLPAVSSSSTASTPDIDYYFPGGYLDLPATWAIFVGLGTTVTNGWVVSPIQGGKF